MGIERWGTGLLVVAMAIGCETDVDVDEDERTIALEIPDTSEMASARYVPEPLSQAEIDSGRYDTSWRRALADDDSAAEITLERFPVDTVDTGESFDDISRVAARTRPVTADTAGGPDDEPDSVPSPTARLPEVHTPLHGPVEGPSVLYAQILLDRTRFSPGIIDGRWGKNTEKAVFWFQRAHDLEATGSVDSLTYRALVDVAGRPDRFIHIATLTEDDVSGPFVELPADVYEQESLECMCYGSLSEKLSERFHVTPEVLERLNEGVTLDSLAAGDSLRVPHVDRAELGEGSGEEDVAREDTTRAGPTGADTMGADTIVTDPARFSSADPGRVTRLRVSDQGHYLHALDAEGRILYHFPTTLGSSYSPSPSGEYTVVSVAFDPWFYYQPELLEWVDPSTPSARIPPGPNNPVGTVWMDLSKPHYGIHGTNEPATIGYTTSSGCIRLTNWDAVFLAERIGPDVPVEFTDLRAER